MCSRSQGHKIYGPKGVAALYVRRRNPPGSDQRTNQRGGHERGIVGHADISGIVGLGAACEIAGAEMEVEAKVRRSFGIICGEVVRRRWTCPRQRQIWASSCRESEHEPLCMSRVESLLMGHQWTLQSRRPRLHVCHAGAQLCAQSAGLGRRVAHSSIRSGLGASTPRLSGLCVRQVIDVVTKLRELESPVRDGEERD